MNGKECSFFMINKKQIILEAKEKLKQLGFRKNKNYWYRYDNEWICCFCIQGSQWDRENYYINIGMAKRCESGYFPTELNWLWRHRCRVDNEELNIPLVAALEQLEEYYKNFCIDKDMNRFLKENNAKWVVQLWDIG